jgi:hypothetical protein
VILFDEQEATEPRQGLFDAGDVIGTIGAGLAGYGIWLIYPPAAFIFGGIALMALAAAMAYRKARI